MAPPAVIDSAGIVTADDETLSRWLGETHCASSACTTLHETRSTIPEAHSRGAPQPQRCVLAARLSNGSCSVVCGPCHCAAFCPARSRGKAFGPTLVGHHRPVPSARAGHKCAGQHAIQALLRGAFWVQLWHTLTSKKLDMDSHGRDTVTMKRSTDARLEEILNRPVGVLRQVSTVPACMLDPPAASPCAESQSQMPAKDEHLHSSYSCCCAKLFTCLPCDCMAMPSRRAPSLMLSRSSSTAC